MNLSQALAEITYILEWIILLYLVNNHIDSNPLFIFNVGKYPIHQNGFKIKYCNWIEQVAQ